MRIRAQLAVIVSLFLCPMLHPVDSTSYKEGRAFVTEGSLDNVLWYDHGKIVLTDYANYNNWALKGLDGKDPVSEKYWEQFVGFTYEKPLMMTLIYNLNLPWPFGSKNNRMHFQIDESRLDCGVLKMTLVDKPMGLENAAFFICAEDSPTAPGARIIRFKTALTFSWFIEAILDVRGYNSHMRTIMALLAGNLEEYSIVSAALIKERQSREQTAERL
ncbi:MAG: hypothetical protein WCT14_20200 [Treponemataceae bacterium]